MKFLKKCTISDFSRRGKSLKKSIKPRIKPKLQFVKFKDILFLNSKITNTVHSIKINYKNGISTNI